MCKTDKDCPRGQTCTSGVCTGTAKADVDELADTEPNEKLTFTTNPNPKHKEYLMSITKIDLSSYTTDCNTTLSSALGYINDAGKTEKAAREKAAAVRAPATLGASEASSAKAIFANVDEQQDAVVAAGLDPQKIFGGLLNQAARLAQSAKDRLIDAANAAA